MTTPSPEHELSASGVSSSTDYEAIRREALAEVDDFSLPGPNLDQAIETAAGDILITNSQRSDTLPMARFNKEDNNVIYGVREEDYLKSVRAYLDECLKLAQSHDSDEVAYDWGDLENETFGRVVDDINNFRENLVYINNAEFENATDLLAEKLIEEAQTGRTIGVYDYKDRSPRFVITKVLSKVSRILNSGSSFSPEEAEVIRARLLYDDDTETLKERILSNSSGDKPPVVYVVDDFALSFTLLKGGMSRVSQRFSDEAGPGANVEVKGLTICSNPGKTNAPDVQTVFEAPEANNYSQVAMAGSWSSTDYGYEGVLERFADRVGLQHPLNDPNKGTFSRQHKIKGRYEKGADGNYLDSQYAAEYQNVVATFGRAPERAQE